jgi:cell wall-associated NlpC family hydrolase
LTAGAIVLAVIAPTVESSDRPAEAGPQPRTVIESPRFDPAVALNKRTEKASRSIRPTARRRVLRAVRTRVKVMSRSVVVSRRSTPSRHRPVRSRRVESRIVSTPGGMAAVIAFARAQIGKAYVSGAEGPGAFDCSGFTKSAYARAGIRLPHSSGAQAARAHTISRSAARPGDLVVGPGHVGLYMGDGMMIDAGNRRTGVVYRRLYAGLHVERL